MEVLKIIPQVFFDLIARVVPGSAGIVAYLLLCGRTWEDMIAGLFGPSFAKEGATLSFLIFLGAGYIVGELISPIAKTVQRINEIKLAASWKGDKTMINKRSNQKTTEVKPGNQEHKEPEFSEEKLRYDRLRFRSPDVGALCAKIRAEFTMHNGLSVVFAASALYYPFSILPFHWHLLAFLLLMVLITSHRGRTTGNTFKETVKKFTQVLNENRTGPESKQVSLSESNMGT